MPILKVGKEKQKQRYAQRKIVKENNSKWVGKEDWRSWRLEKL